MNRSKFQREKKTDGNNTQLSLIQTELFLFKLFLKTSDIRIVNDLVRMSMNSLVKT